jgi:hypothetical protein
VGVSGGAPAEGDALLALGDDLAEVAALGAGELARLRGAERLGLPGAEGALEGGRAVAASMSPASSTAMLLGAYQRWK